MSSAFYIFIFLCLLAMILLGSIGIAATFSLHSSLFADRHGIAALSGEILIFLATTAALIFLFIQMIRIMDIYG